MKERREVFLEEVRRNLQNDVARLPGRHALVRQEAV
jgi:hypothetical protein